MLSSAVSGSLSAYTSSKSFSPRFKYGAELVERHIGSPVATTVTTASRITGVDSAARWFYRRSVSGKKERATERRRVKDKNFNEERDVEQGLDDSSLLCLARRDPGMSMGDTLSSPSEALPSYDSEGRSPTYQAQELLVQQRPRAPGPGMLTATGPPPDLYSPMSRPIGDSLAPPCEPLPSYDPEGRSPRYQRQDSYVQSGQGAGPPNDPTRRSSVTIASSALGIAMSQKSLDGLKECLRLLREANDKIGSMATDLKDVIQGKFDQPAMEADNDAQSNQQGAIIQTMHDLKSGINSTYSKALEHVSKLGALPVSIGEQIRTHIFSLPRRVFYALPSRRSPMPSSQRTMTQDASGAERAIRGTPAVTESCLPEKEVRSAQRVVVMATEMLDILSQVSGIVGGTIDSAEQFLDRFGQRPRGRGSNEARRQQPQESRQECGKDDDTEKKVVKEEPGADDYEDMKAHEKEDVEMKNEDVDMKKEDVEMK
ncbi:MAG: hypothetical protein Q9216_001644 [Gyalolechia sp. 2 TL-2023]